jgi:hypothetical protein
LVAQDKLLSQQQGQFQLRLARQEAVIAQLKKEQAAAAATTAERERELAADAVATGAGAGAYTRPLFYST